MGQDLAPALRDQYEILDTDAELAGQVDAGLHGDQHAGLEDGLLLRGEIRSLVNLKAHAVAERMAEGLAIAGVRDDVAGNLVDPAADGAGTDGGNRGAVRPEDQTVDLLVKRRRPRGNDVPGHIGAEAVQLDAEVDEERFTLVPDGRIRHVVAFGGVRAGAGDRLEGLAIAQLVHDGADDALDGLFGHAGTNPAAGLGPDAVVHRLGGAQAGDLVRRLHGAELREFAGDVHERGVRHRLREADVAG